MTNTQLRQAGLSLRQIALLQGVSHVSVWRSLRREGENTSRSAKEQVITECALCHRPLKLVLSRAKQYNYCSQTCAWQARSRKPDLLRVAAAQHYPLYRLNEVVPRDGDPSNTSVENLLVFEDAEAARLWYLHKRGKPVFDGAKEQPDASK